MFVYSWFFNRRLIDLLFDRFIQGMIICFVDGMIDGSMDLLNERTNKWETNEQIRNERTKWNEQMKAPNSKEWINVPQKSEWGIVMIYKRIILSGPTKSDGGK